jgi:hypothetical protein
VNKVNFFCFAEVCNCRFAFVDKLPLGEFELHVLLAAASKVRHNFGLYRRGTSKANRGDLICPDS